MNAYVPIMILGAIGVAFAVFSVFIGIAIGPKRYNRAKLEPYECGIEPVEQSLLYPARRTAGGTVATGSIQRVPVKYYLTAMLFIIFDVEMIFLYPFAVATGMLAWFGFIEMVIFVLTVFIAYAYVWRRGGLDWN